MDHIKMESDKKLLVRIFPELVWTEVLRYLTASFQLLESCSEASDFFDSLIQMIGHFSVVSRDQILSTSYHDRISYVPKRTGLIIFPEPILAKPQIRAMDICMSPNFRPINAYLKWFIVSQSDSLETLHISCLGIVGHSIKFKLPEMPKLRDFQIVRNVILDKQNYITKSLKFCETPVLPALESLTLSAFGASENWNDFLGSKEPEHPSCPTVQHLRLLPSRPFHIRCVGTNISNFVFPNLVSLEIPAVFLDAIYKLFPTPKSLKRLTLTLPTRGLHKHLYDVAITGYSEQVCAAILANPDANPEVIRAEIGEENEGRLDDFEEWERTVIVSGNEMRRDGKRFCNLTNFTDLEELRLKSDSGNWGPTLVSCPDLLRMKSLKILQFCGFIPKYIPDDMIRKLTKRFTIQTPSFDNPVGSTIKIMPRKQNLLKTQAGTVWKQVFGCFSFAFPTAESGSEDSDVFEDLFDKPGVLSITRNMLRPDKFRQWLYSHPEFPPTTSQILPRIRTLDISINSNFHPLGYHLNCFLESQRDSLEVLNISCLGTPMDCLEIELRGMCRLRDLQINRNIEWDQEREMYHRSLHFTQPPVVPALEILTLSSNGSECWQDILEKPDGSRNLYPTCVTVKHIRLLPSRPSNLYRTYWSLSSFVFPNLVSLEIPAIHLDLISQLLVFRDTLKRLTLTLPTENLHKHLFDVAITGYGEQVCAALLATKRRYRNAIRIRREIEEANFRNMDNLEFYEASRVKWDVRYLRRRTRFPGITSLSGLEELRLVSDAGDWGPTRVSCPDLLRMESLKSIHFSRFKPKYLRRVTMKKLKKRFTVLIG